MASETSLSNTALNAEADALSTLLDDGYYRIYSGSKPANANTALSGNTLLVEMRFRPNSAPSAINGVISFTDFEAVIAIGSGDATFFRCFASDGTTVVMDGTIATTNANGTITNVTIQSGMTITQSGFTHTITGEV